MPFTYSIDRGILFGILGYTLSKLAVNKKEEITNTVWVLTVVLTAYLVLEGLLK